MALEFNCPYCQAVIRVPDASAGKRGRCPKCATKISIPKASAVRKAAGVAPILPPGFEPEPPSTPVESDDEVVFEEYDPSRDASLELTAGSHVAPGDIVLPVSVAPAFPPDPRPIVRLPDSVLSKKVRRRRSSAWIWIVVALLLLGGGGVAGFTLWRQQQANLTGKLTGQLVETAGLPVKVIPKSEIEMPTDDADQIFQELERTPIPLMSSRGLATVHFQANEQGLVISVAPGSATSLYRVPIHGDAKLETWLREHEAELEQIRREDVAIAANQLFRLLKKFFAKQASGAELGPFRDSVGLAGSVSGLGHVVQAVHQRDVYPCVYQDDEALYFLLPAGVKRFQIQGKARAKSPIFFPGKYDVEIDGTYQLEVEAEEDATEIRDSKHEIRRKSEIRK
jgi:hypothetical protein